MHLTSLLPRPVAQTAGLLSFLVSALASDGAAADRAATLEAIRNLEKQHLAVHVGEAEVAALEAERQLLVVEAEQVQEGGVDVVHVARSATG
jgi:mRNA-degrading endonuclease toxin of MazEF toxin-antitoxin module